MTPSQHFLFSFASALLGATTLAVGTILFRDWLEERGAPSNIMALVLFIVSFQVIRWYFRNCVPITCPRCHQKRSYTITGRSDRFRCEVCGADC